jgi:hypothetical protein
MVFTPFVHVKKLFTRTGAYSAQRLPLGEAVATIGSSEPIVVTDEGLPQADYTEMSINLV